MRHFFASTIEESDVEQETATTAADIVSTSRANVAIVEPPLIESVVSVAPPASAHTHVYESADVGDGPVWVLRAAAPTAAGGGAPCVAHSAVLPRTALSAVQAKGTAPIAHPTPHMESQYLHHRTLGLLLLTFIRHQHLLQTLRYTLLHLLYRL